MQYLQLAGQSLVGQKVLCIVVFNCSRSQKAEEQAWKERLPSASVGVASFTLGTYRRLGQAVPCVSSAPPLPPLPPLDPHHWTPSPKQTPGWAQDGRRMDVQATDGSSVKSLDQKPQCASNCRHRQRRHCPTTCSPSYLPHATLGYCCVA
jgi:hypothetical protein